MDQEVLVRSPNGDFSADLPKRKVNIQIFCLRKEVSFSTIYQDLEKWVFTEPEVKSITDNYPWVIRNTGKGISFFLLKKKDKDTKKIFFQVVGLSFDPSSSEDNGRKLKVNRLDLNDQTKWSPGRLEDYYFFAPSAL
jgi:hypothetical protein